MWGLFTSPKTQKGGGTARRTGQEQRLWFVDGGVDEGWVEVTARNQEVLDESGQSLECGKRKGDLKRRCKGYPGAPLLKFYKGCKITVKQPNVVFWLLKMSNEVG